MAKTTEGRLAYADLLRVLSLAAAVALHVCGIWYPSAPVGSGAWAVYNVYSGLLRWCAPVFVMLSGAFLLDPRKGLTLPSLFFRHILRVFTALVVWGAVYAVFDYGWVDGRLSWNSVRAALKTALLGDTHFHFWFLYVVLGLYLVTPILRAFVRGASRGDFHFFFVVAFLFASLLPLLLKLRPNAVVSTYLDRLDLHLVLGFVGFYAAGYYLKAYGLGRIAEAVIYLLGVAGAVATVWGSSALSLRGGSSTLLTDFMAPNVAAMAVAVFVLFRYLLGVSDERDRRRSLSGAARITFGVYLAHVLFLMLYERLGVAHIPLPPVAAVPLVTAAVFLPSLAVSWVLNKIPFVGHYLT